MYEAQLATPPSGVYVHRLGKRDRYGLGAAAATGILQGIDEGLRVTRLFNYCMEASGYTLIDKAQPVPVVSEVTPPTPPEDIRKPEQTRNTFIRTSPAFTPPSQPQPQLQTLPQTTDTYKGHVVSASGYNERGFEQYKNARYDKAIEDLTVALSMQGNPSSSVYINRGASFYELKQYDNALADFKQAITMAPDNARGYGWCGNIYYAVGLYHEALEYYSKAIDRDPKKGLYYFNRGYANLGISDRLRAISDFKMACNMGIQDGCNQAEK